LKRKPPEWPAPSGSGIQIEQLSHSGAVTRRARTPRRVGHRIHPGTGACIRTSYQRYGRKPRSRWVRFSSPKTPMLPYQVLQPLENRSPI